MLAPWFGPKGIEIDLCRRLLPALCLNLAVNDFTSLSPKLPLGGRSKVLGPAMVVSSFFCPQFCD